MCINIFAMEKLLSLVFGFGFFPHSTTLCFAVLFYRSFFSSSADLSGLYYYLVLSCIAQLVVLPRDLESSPATLLVGLFPVLFILIAHFIRTMICYSRSQHDFKYYLLFANILL